MAYFFSSFAEATVVMDLIVHTLITFYMEYISNTKHIKIHSNLRNVSARQQCLPMKAVCIPLCSGRIALTMMKEVLNLASSGDPASALVKDSVHASRHQGSAQMGFNK